MLLRISVILLYGNEIMTIKQKRHVEPENNENEYFLNIMFHAPMGRSQN